MLPDLVLDPPCHPAGLPVAPVAPRVDGAAPPPAGGPGAGGGRVYTGLRLEAAGGAHVAGHQVCTGGNSG